MIEKMLQLNPNYRISIKDILEHPYLKNAPDQVPQSKFMEFVHSVDPVANMKQ